MPGDRHGAVVMQCQDGLPPPLSADRHGPRLIRTAGMTGGSAHTHILRSKPLPRNVSVRDNCAHGETGRLGYGRAPGVLPLRPP